MYRQMASSTSFRVSLIVILSKHKKPAREGWRNVSHCVLGYTQPVLRVGCGVSRWDSCRLLGELDTVCPQEDHNQNINVSQCSWDSMRYTCHYDGRHYKPHRHK